MRVQAQEFQKQQRERASSSGEEEELEPESLPRKTTTSVSWREAAAPRGPRSRVWRRPWGAKGIVLSGGPASVYEEGVPTTDPGLLKLGVPILGICYGMQHVMHRAGGRVSANHVSE